jgi:hypothetical protein
LLSLLVNTTTGKLLIRYIDEIENGLRLSSQQSNSNTPILLRSNARGPVLLEVLTLIAASAQVSVSCWNLQCLREHYHGVPLIPHHSIL